MMRVLLHMPFQQHVLWLQKILVMDLVSRLVAEGKEDQCS